jgi:integrase
VTISRLVSGRTGKVTWRVRIKQGRIVVESATFSALSEAKLFESTRRMQMSRPDWVDPARGRVHLGEVAADYLASRSNVAPLTQGTDNQMYSQHIAPAFGKLNLIGITAADITEWLGRLADRGVAPSTRRRALAVLRGILAHAVADRRLRVSPAAGVKAPNGGARREGIALSREEVMRLLIELPEECRPPVLLMAITGIRVSEMCGLRVGDVHRSPQGYLLRLQRSISQSSDSGKAFIGDLKSHRARSVPVPRPLIGWVAARIENTDPVVPLFATKRGQAWTRGNFATRSEWTKARKRAGLPDVRIHDLRHTAASAMLSAQPDVLAVSRVLGHSTPTLTLSLYGHVMDQGIIRVIEAVEGNWGDFGGTVQRKEEGNPSV